MNAPDKYNLSHHLREQLSGEIIAFTRLAGTIAEKRGMRLYLVGGVVRDILLERLNTDLDLAVEGDAIKLAKEIALGLQARLTTHSRFGTATIKLPERSIDLITARTEIYTKPGALPKVTPCSIKEDMARRDFTINAMAISLNPDNYGELYDPFGGMTDADRAEIRILHEKSFTDDATRIWRAIRYEQRLDFHIEPITLLLIERDIDMLKTISGERIRHELELVLKEEEPEKILARAEELGVLEKLNPYIKADKWLAERFSAARDACQTALPHPNLYLALLCYRLIPADAERFISYLRLPKAAAEAIKDTLAIKSRIKELSRDGQSPSVIYNLLSGYCPLAYEASRLAMDSPAALEHIELYESVLRYIHPALNGDDLKKLGVPKGPKMKAILKGLLDAKLDGQTETKFDEENWIKERLKS
jgi:tRNA nucleotidyltransferase (CCA-adding enzyme)